MAYVNEKFRAGYAPYDKMAAFDEGMQDYATGHRKEYSGVNAQAYDRGLECAMRIARANGLISAADFRLLERARNA